MQQKNRKVLNFDVETTGLFPNTNGIVQLAGIIEINGEQVEEFNLKMRPFKDDIIDKESLKIQKRTVEEVMSWMDPEEAYAELIEIFDKYIDRYDRSDKFYPCGFNVPFDINFLIQWFKKNDDQYIGSWINLKAQVDPLPILRFLDYMGKIDMEDYKLETIANVLDVPIEAHDALSDIRATIQIRDIVEQLIDCE